MFLVNGKILQVGWAGHQPHAMANMFRGPMQRLCQAIFCVGMFSHLVRGIGTQRLINLQDKLAIGFIKG
jgi:hypothetical protein